MRLFKITLAVILVLASLITSVSCGKGDDEVTQLSFAASAGYDYLKTLDGTRVAINGYMATSSPVDGSFMFLMNLPYQSCPFCEPNTSKLSNTMEIFPKDGEKFTYTAQAIRVEGTLVVAESEDEPFTDKFGYQFAFKIVDADYKIIKAEDLSENMALWQRIAESDVISEIYRMYDFVNFTVAWNTYTVKSQTDADGTVYPGYYLHSADAEKFLYTEGWQFNYGVDDGYFDSIVAKIEAIDKEAFSELVANVRRAETLAKRGLSELKNKNYTSEYKYVEEFGTEDYIFTLNNGEEMRAEMDAIYREFAHWLGSWEL